MVAASTPVKLVHEGSSNDKTSAPLVHERLEQSTTDNRDQATKLNQQEPKPYKTQAELEAEQKKTLQYVLVDARKIIHLITSGVCAVTALFSKFLPESNGLRRTFESLSSNLARLAIGIISGISGAFDAFKDGKYLLAWSQIGDAITTLVAPTEEITNYRGLWVGAYNALPSAETVEGKSKYESFGDNLKTTLSAFKKVGAELIRNPASLVDPSRSGMLGVVTGVLTSGFSLLYMLTGIKAFASGRDALGMGVETEKLKSVHYKAGRSQYIASGWTMLLGSAANMVSKFTEGSSKKMWSYWNLAANAIGKLFYLDALQNNEPAREQASVDNSQMIKNTLREAFDWGKQTKASIERAQPLTVQDDEIVERIEEIKQEENEAKKLSSADKEATRYSSSSPVRRSRSTTRAQSTRKTTAVNSFKSPAVGNVVSSNRVVGPSSKRPAVKATSSASPPRKTNSRASIGTASKPK